MEVTTRVPKGKDLGKDPECPVRGVLARVGEKWPVLVITHLAEAPLRFSELKRRIDGISQRMLTETVRVLERDGVLLRTVYPTIPPRVEYSLTPLGRTLLVPVQALVVWALENRAEINEAREAYDEEQAQPIEAVAQVRRASVRESFGTG